MTPPFNVPLDAPPCPPPSLEALESDYISLLHVEANLLEKAARALRVFAEAEEERFRERRETGAVRICTDRSRTKAALAYEAARSEVDAAVAREISLRNLHACRFAEEGG